MSTRHGSWWTAGHGSRLEASILHKGSGLRIVAVSEKADPEKVAALKQSATVIVAGKKEVDLAALMDELGTMGIQRVMVEGGGELIAGLIRAGLVDEIYTFIGNLIIGGSECPHACRRGRVHNRGGVPPAYPYRDPQDRERHSPALEG